MSAPIKDGGSAFPVMYCSEGMSLRDYFAGQALAGMVTSGKAIEWKACEIADGCYSLADSMLAARNQGDAK
jgi:hypothetical protein